MISFVSSTMDLFLLNKAPDFTEKSVQQIELSDTKAGSIASSEVTYPAYGDLYGKILVPSLGIDEPLFFGDDLDILSLGAGHFIGSVFPGEKGTTLVGAHSYMSGFGKLADIQIGDVVSVPTSYGNYEYVVEETKVLPYDSGEITQALSTKDSDRLLLYTCYPVGVLGLTDQRLFVFCSYQAGPEIGQ